MKFRCPKFRILRKSNSCNTINFPVILKAQPSISSFDFESRIIGGAIKAPLLNSVSTAVDNAF
jgi:hypothetical protein